MLINYSAYFYEWDQQIHWKDLIQNNVSFTNWVLLILSWTLMNMPRTARMHIKSFSKYRLKFWSVPHTTLQKTWKRTHMDYCSDTIYLVILELHSYSPPSLSFNLKVWPEYCSKIHLLCFTEESKSHKIETTWVWVNHFHFWLNYSFKQKSRVLKQQQEL